MSIKPEIPWRVLVVEDEPDLANALCETLQNQGAIVFASPNGRSALHFMETLRKQQRELPDLIITDLRMPELSGMELIAALEERQFVRPKFLAMSAEAGREDLLALLRAGVADFLEKPFSLKRFNETIEKLRSSHWQEYWEKQRIQKLEAENSALRQRMRDWLAREALSRITRGILHDMNNCLAIIQGSAEMIQMALETGGKTVDSYAASISDITLRAVDTLSQLQALNRLGEGLWTTFDMRKLIEGTHGLIRTAMGTHIRIEEQLGDCALWVQGDAVQLQNAWIRLLVTLRDWIGPLNSVIQVSGRLRCHRLPDGLLEGFVEIRLGISNPTLKASDDLPNLSTHQEMLQSQGCELISTVDLGGQSYWTALLPAGAIPLDQGHGIESAALLVAVESL
jgi:DNA-binding response OmpR family regulator